MSFMSDSPRKSRFVRLLDVGNKMSSEERRALLREVTDVFVEPAAGDIAGKLADLDRVLSSVISDFSREIRAELAATIGPSKVPLAVTAERLALDDIEVARPVLEQSMVLSHSSLLAVVAQKTQEHLLLVAKRRDVSTDVSRALVRRGDDRVVTSLLQNARAEIAHETYEAVTELALARPLLYAPFVRRSDVPLELLNEIYLEVEANLRREILIRYDRVSPQELDAALERSRAKFAKAHRRSVVAAADVRARLDDYRRRGELSPLLMIRLLREGEQSRAVFIAVFAALAGVENDLATKVLEGGDIDALALLCRAAALERAIFVSLAVALVGTDRRMTKVEEFGALYENVPVSAAQRAVRFWKARAAGAD